MKLSLAQNICRLRKQNGLTQERLAEALGVSFAAVSKWERGVATPDLASLFCSQFRLVLFPHGHKQLLAPE